MEIRKVKQSWKANLKRLKLDSIKSRSAAFFEASGGYEMKITPDKDTTSNGLTRCIIDYINFNGGYANRIHFIISGKHVTIEVKAGDDRLSLSQLTEMVRVTNAGGYYFIARSMESFLNWYEETILAVES